VGPLQMCAWCSCCCCQCVGGCSYPWRLHPSLRSHSLQCTRLLSVCQGARVLCREMRLWGVQVLLLRGRGRPGGTACCCAGQSGLVVPV
jgi:hypothetical protein